MPRKRVQRDPCDCLECRDPFTADSSLGVAAAQQSPPPKCLVLSVDCTSNKLIQPLDALKSEWSLPHIRAVAKDGCSCILAFRSSPSLEGPDTKKLQQLAHLVQLFGTEKARPQEVKGGKGDPNEPDSYLRLNMYRAMMCILEFVLKLAKEAGFDSAYSLKDVAHEDGAKDSHAVSLAAILLDLLGLNAVPATNPIEDPQRSSDEQQQSSSDLLFIDLGSLSGPSGASSTSKVHVSNEAWQGTSLEYLDTLLQSLNRRPAFHERVLLVLFFWLRDSNGSFLPQLGGRAIDEVNEGFTGILRPVQSHELAANQPVEVDGEHVIVSYQRLANVIRRDEQTTLPASGQRYRAGQGCILAERWLPEIAYKLGCAAKYGA